ATVGLAQNDIKRVVAYSTCSQLGYMFFAAGLGAYSAAMFHLFTHAFFKALLFLTAGAVIHGLHDEQDLRKMGGLRTKMPIAWLMMLLGTLALTGVGIPGTKIGFAGFFSKDVIIEMAFLDGGVYGMFAFYCGIAAAVLTSFYSWRLMLMTFHGKTRAPQDHYDHAHDAPSVMGVPLYLLAAGAVFAGALFYSPFIGKLGEQNEKFWGDAIYVTDAGGHGAHAEHGDDHGADDHAADDAHAAEATHADDHHSEDAHGDDAHGDDAHGGHHVPTWVLWAPFFAWVGGLLFALYFYGLRAGLGAKIAANGGPLHSFLSNKWYFDELYNATVVKATALLGDLFWKVGDGKIIDGLGPDGVSATAKATSGRLSKLHTGYLYHYAFVILIGAVVFGGVALLGASGAE
ncbi:MAG: proton-conducting transporter membrane subunit, partial [Pseudomonadota bacterium]